MPGCEQTIGAAMATFRLSLWRQNTEAKALDDYSSKPSLAKRASA
jgi:hypothetical protein